MSDTCAIDLQVQREGESDRAYAAYLEYRDLGERRTMLKAYEKYIAKAENGEAKVKKGVRPSKAFREWFDKFEWTARAKAWDNGKRQIIQDAQIKDDCNDYLRRLEDGRTKLEKVSKIALDEAELSIMFSKSQLQRLVLAVGDGRATLTQLKEYNLIVKGCQDSVNVLAIAKTEFYDALGLVETLGIIGNAKD